MDPNLHQSYPTPSPTIPYSRGWHITKIIFHSFSIIFCIVVLGISIALSLNFYPSPFILLRTIPQAGVALCWSVAELITICARTGQRGIHPGAHVALHLLLWLGFCASLGLNGLSLASMLIYSEYSEYYDYDYDYDYYDTYGFSGYLGAIQALVAFLSLLITQPLPDTQPNLKSPTFPGNMSMEKSYHTMSPVLARGTYLSRRYHHKFKEMDSTQPHLVIENGMNLGSREEVHAGGTWPA
ncbi:hypothetical protein DL769_000235 [Monosporascus sp. CRB-8-3]|nr:hypothetical protein DL769_000235 [Monosporascus sp. CRB-8-3]